MAITAGQPSPMTSRASLLGSWVWGEGELHDAVAVLDLEVNEARLECRVVHPVGVVEGEGESIGPVGPEDDPREPAAGLAGQVRGRSEARFVGPKAFRGATKSRRSFLNGHDSSPSRCGQKGVHPRGCTHGFGRADEAADAYCEALALVANDLERSLLAGRLDELQVRRRFSWHPLASATWCVSRMRSQPTWQPTDSRRR
ncbi:MAG: hypothetical protein ACJ71T_01350 [Actinomycetales bacterium]